MSEEEVRVRGIKNNNESNTFSVMPPMSLHGRRQILTDVPEVNASNVVEVLDKALNVHARNRSEEVYLEKYLRGIQPIIDRVKVYHQEICNRVVVNVANQIVTFKTAEFAGEPIQYISRGSKKSVPKKVETLNSLMLSEGKQSKDMQLAYNMFTYGVGYRLVLNDKAVDDKNSDTGEIRYTVYTPNETFTIDGNAQSAGQIVSIFRHNFGAVTLIEYPCNTVYMGAFEVVLPLLDAYNTTMSNRLDGIEQFIQAIMVFEGVDVTAEQLTELKEMGALKLPPSQDGRQSRVYYLNEQLDQSQTQTLVDDIYHTILQIVGMPSQGDANRSDSSNNGAVIMKNGWWNAEARSLETEGGWKQAETEFLKIVLKICRESNVLDKLSVSDVEPKFGRRSYEDLLVKTQSFSTLTAAGCPPIQAFTFSKLSKDPESDALTFEAYQEEKAEELDEVPKIASSIQTRTDSKTGKITIDRTPDTDGGDGG